MTSFFTNHGCALRRDRRRGRSDATAAGRTEEASRITVAGAQLDGMAIERVRVALDVLRTDNAPRVRDGYMSESTTGHVRALAAHR